MLQDIFNPFLYRTCPIKNLHIIFPIFWKRQYWIIRKL